MQTCSNRYKKFLIKRYVNQKIIDNFKKMKSSAVSLKKNFVSASEISSASLIKNSPVPASKSELSVHLTTLTSNAATSLMSESTSQPSINGACDKAFDQTSASSFFEPFIITPSLIFQRKNMS